MFRGNHRGHGPIQLFRSTRDEPPSRNTESDIPLHLTHENFHLLARHKADARKSHRDGDEERRQSHDTQQDVGQGRSNWTDEVVGLARC